MAGERRDGEPYPFVRRSGPLAIIGCSTAEATAPFRATGPFREDQAERLAALLAMTDGAFRVILIHHPPVRGAAKRHKRMLGIERFERAVRESGAELVLHGHTHLPTRHAFDTPRGAVPVIGVSAAGQAPGGRRPAARYNLFEIDGEPGAWRCTQIERGIQGDGEVDEIARRELDVPRC